MIFFIFIFFLGGGVLTSFKCTISAWLGSSFGQGGEFSISYTVSFRSGDNVVYTLAEEKILTILF